MPTPVTGPYSIDSWNEEIIRPINDLAINPPNPVDCPPFDPLDEVTDPHKWNLQHIDEIHTLLMQICPDNNFTDIVAPFRLDTFIVQEILDAIARGRCDCCAMLDEHQVTDTYGPGEIEAATWPHLCCGITIVGKYGATTTYNSDWYPCCDENYDKYYELRLHNMGYYQSAMALLGTAMNEYVSNVLQMKAWEETKQNLIDQMDAWIDEYIALGDCSELNDGTPAGYSAERQCVFHKADLAGRICWQGEDIIRYQDLIDSYYDRLGVIYPWIETSKEAADMLAAENVDVCLGMEVRFAGIDHNFMVDIIEIINGIIATTGPFEWFKWWNPYADYFTFFNAHPQNLPGNGGRHAGFAWEGMFGVSPDTWNQWTQAARTFCTAVQTEPHEDVGSGVRSYVQNSMKYTIRPIVRVILHTDCEFYGHQEINYGYLGISPNGTFSFQPGQVHAFMAELAIKSFSVTTISGTQLVGWTGGCEDLLTGRFVYPISPVDHAKFWPKYKSMWVDVQFKGPLTKFGSDYTAKQTQYFDECNNWYTTYPKYDNRHQVYC